MPSLENDRSNVCTVDEDENLSVQQEFLLRETQKLSKTGNWSFDLKSQATQWSEEMFNIHGLHREFNTNDYCAVLSLYEEQSRQLFLDAGAKLFSDKIPFDLTARILTPLGHVKWVRVLGFPKVKAGVVTGIVGITSDITAQKRTEHLLKASEAKFKKAFHGSSDLLALVRESDMVIVDVNEQVEPMLGYSRDELVGNVTPGLRLYQEPMDRARFLNMYFEEGSAELECRWRKKSGEVMNVLLKGTRVEINDQFYFLIVLKDLSLVEDKTEPLPSAAAVHANIDTSLSRLVRHLAITADDFSSKLVLPSSEGFIFIRPRDILFCAADGNYTQIHLTNNRKQVVTKTLKDIEQLLPAEFFFRTHHSFIVNTSHIKKYHKADGTLLMENGATLDVSKRKKDSFLKHIGAVLRPSAYPFRPDISKNHTNTN